MTNIKRKINNNSESIFIAGNKLFWINKRFFDIFVSLMLIPLLILTYISLMILNKFFNKGCVLFYQKRMGMNCSAFYAIKFRSMYSMDTITRKFDDPIEYDRITPLGKILRKIRLDELPQIINVLKGEMSLIGPRPDYFDHAVEYVKSINGYRERYLVRPGISGLSQIRLGYAEGLEATIKKSNIDNYYIKNTSYLLELKIIFSTLVTIIKALGS